MGVDLQEGVDAETFTALRDVLHERGAVLFRNQILGDEEYLRFARQLGELETHALQKSNLVILTNAVKDGKPLGLFEVGQFWHSDGSYTPTPSMYTLLYGIEIPHDADGNPLGGTWLTSTAAAYDGLASDFRKKLEGLKAVYSYDYRYQQRKAANASVVASPSQTAYTDVRHPVIWIHPVTGRKAIFVNEGYVTHLEGVPKAEGDAILKDLLAHVVSEKYVYRHEWKARDVLVFDHNSTQHRAIADYDLPQLRFIKRIGVKAP